VQLRIANFHESTRFIGACLCSRNRNMKKESDDLIPTRWTLIGRLKNWDDQESWREFFDTYWKLIYGVGIKSGLSHSEAQDVVQETVISVCRKMEAFKADPAYGSFKSWLLKLIRWRICDRVRKRGREIAADANYEGDASQGSPKTSAENKIEDPAGNRLEAIWNEEWGKHVVGAALEKVKRQSNGKHYQVFFLLTIKQVPPDKVAKTLSMKVNQVYLIKHRLSKLFEEAIRGLETDVR
jgi:RNA polymerase sigma factor (sigma-70 family)